MRNNFITNTGLTQTIVHNNNKTHFNELTWDADYDGNIANISVMKNSDGKKENYDITMDNNDLAKILNIPSISLPLDKRLEMDFENHALRKEPTYYTVELSNKLPNTRNKHNTEERDLQIVPFTKSSQYLSSPLTNEEFIIPNLRKGKYTLLKKSKHHKRKKPTHITYKVYKKTKTNSTQNKRSKQTLRRHGKI